MPAPDHSSPVNASVKIQGIVGEKRLHKHGDAEEGKSLNVRGEYDEVVNLRRNKAQELQDILQYQIKEKR